MDLTLVYLYAYAIAWAVVLIVYYYKNRTVGLGGMLIITYLISAVTTSIFYTAADSLDAMGMLGQDLTWPPLVYLFVLQNIIMYPVYKYSNKISEITIAVKPGGDSLFTQFVLLCSPFIIEAFLEMTYIALTFDSSSLGMVYESEIDVAGDNLSFIGRKTMIIVRWFMYIWPILFFYFLNQGKAKRKQLLIMGCAMLAIMFEAYANAKRVGIVRYMMYILIIFLIMRSSIDTDLRKKITRVLAIVFGGFVAFLWLITIARFEMGSGDDIWVWISLYTGEAPIRFCQYLWDLKGNMGGDNLLSVFKTILGLDTFTDTDMRREYYENALGVPNRIFYTSLGDFVLDFGKEAAAIIYLILAFLINKYLKNSIKNETFELSKVLNLGLIILTMEFGIMYFTFKLYGQQLMLIPNFLFVIVYKMYCRRHPVY